MNAFAQAWSAILPLRWYMAVLLGQAARGLPVADSAIPFAALAGLALLFAGLAWLRMANLTRKGWFATARPAEPPAIEPHAARHRRRLRGGVAARAGNAERLQRCCSSLPWSTASIIRNPI